jgi:hypothetical protein
MICVDTQVEIVSALTLPEIQKLKFVWSHVSSKNTFNKLRGFMEGNFTKLQDKLHNVQPPCLPYLGAYLYALVEIDDKHPPQLQGLINFEKRTLMASAIAEIQQYQQTLFCLEAVPFIQEWMESEEVWTPEQVNDATAPLLIKPEKTKPIKKSTLKVKELCGEEISFMLSLFVNNVLFCFVLRRAATGATADDGR